MTFQQIQKLLSLTQYAPEEEQNEIANLIAKTAAFQANNSDSHLEPDGSVRFTQKEISKMPKTFKKEFRTDGCTAHVRKRRSGKHNWNYEIRYRRNGYDIQVSANSLDEAKRKFIDRLSVAEKAVNKASDAAIPSTFTDFADYFFENFYKRKVAASTLRVALNQFKNHLQPCFGNMQLKKITPKKCQILLDKLEAEGKGKTAEDLFTILNLIFKAAVKHGLIPNNPMDMVFHQKHEREHGKALTKAEERLLLEKTADTPYQLMFAIALYTGLRPNEYKTARIEDNFIVSNNSKRKNGKTELKKIPVTPMLKPYLEDITELYFTRLEQIRNKFNKILPGHRLYDLRTTFYTRCMECGVADAAIKKFVGHTLGGLADTYADLSDEFLLTEGRKLDYTYDNI